MNRLAPEQMRGLNELGQSIELDAGLQELVKVRASILNGCAFCVDMHTTAARAAGESERRLHALAAWEDAPFFSPRERAALALTDAVTRIGENRVGQELYDAVTVHFEPEELAHLIIAISVINAWNRIAITSRLSLPQPNRV